MSEALQLFDVPEEPKLTDRQKHALQAIVDAGYEGLHTDELGARVHAWQGKHSPDDRCQWCSAVGKELGGRLRELELAQQRRRKLPGGDTVMVWTVPGKLDAPRAVSPDIWPEGF